MLHVSVHSYVRVTEDELASFFTVRVENIYTRFSGEREAIPLFLPFFFSLSLSLFYRDKVKSPSRYTSPRAESFPELFIYGERKTRGSEFSWVLFY